MKMSCLLSHDWHEVDWIKAEDVRVMVRKQFDYPFPLVDVYSATNRICLRCGKLQDNIQEEIKRAIEAADLKFSRLKLAKKLYEEGKNENNRK